MESRSTRDHGCHHLNQQLRPPWSYGFSLAGGISWPPQMRSSSSSSYSCGYCKREFRSAQALGGHMNVHRRERARLRHYCNPSYPAHRPAPPLPNLNFSPPHFPGDGASTTVAAPAVYSFFSTASATAGATSKAALEVNLELGVGGCSDGGLDLELRLGCS